MNRRQATLALIALGATGTWRAAGAQQSGRMWRIGYLGPPAADAPHLIKAFQDGLRELGYVEGRNVVVEYRWTTNLGTPLDLNALVAVARELAALRLDVLAVSIDPPTLAAKQVSGTTPIVMMNVSDPVALGLVASLAHPGGSVTGLMRQSPEMVGKNVQLLLEMVPGARRVALLTSETGAMTPLITSNARAAARSRGLELQVVAIRSEADLDAAFATLKRGRADALVVPGDGVFFVHRAQIAELTRTQRLPGVFAYTENVVAGGLLSYSPSSTENYRRAATYIDKILRGAKPGDLPVEQPTKFELAINLNTAKAMGIVVPQSMLLRADRVIE